MIAAPARNRRAVLALSGTESNTARAVYHALVLEGWEVATCPGDQLDKELQSSVRIRLILFDLSSLSAHEIELYRLARAHFGASVPLIAICASKESMQDELISQLLHLGFDDVLTSTTGAKEAKARIRRQLELPERSRGTNVEVLACGNLKVFPAQFTGEIRGKRVLLGETELILLRVFISAPGVLITHRRLLEAFQGRARYSEHHVAVKISRLRKLLAGFDHEIVAAWGRGYVLRPKANR